MTTEMEMATYAAASDSANGNGMVHTWQSRPSGAMATMRDHEQDPSDLEEEDDTTGDADDASDGSQRKYERKTKRFAWPDELHRLFVAAIFDLGLKSASPKALLPFMQPTAANAGLTTEHMKSHLQKYRLHYDKSRCEFLSFYDESNRRNGRRRRRSAKSTESHTRFIFPITPSVATAAATSGGDGGVATGSNSGNAQRHQQLPSSQPQPQRKANGVPITSTGALSLPQQSTRFDSSEPAPLSRADRATLLRIAQQNAAIAFAAGAQGNLLGAGYPAPRDMVTNAGADGVSDAQWGMLASLLSPQITAATGDSSDPTGFSGSQPPPPTTFSLGDGEQPSDLQLQMHLAMQTQMNLHRQMLSRKVEVSQNYVNHAAAVKRAAASAMVERALQNVAVQQQQQSHQHQQQQMDYQSQQGQYAEYAGMAPSRPSISDASALMQQQQYMQQLQQQQHQNQYVASPFASLRGPSLAPSDVLLPVPWDGMDIDMGLGSDDQTDLFSFLKATE